MMKYTRLGYRWASTDSMVCSMCFSEFRRGVMSEILGQALVEALEVCGVGPVIIIYCTSRCIAGFSALPGALLA